MWGHRMGGSPPNSTMQSDVTYTFKNHFQGYFQQEGYTLGSIKISQYQISKSYLSISKHYSWHRTQWKQILFFLFARFRLPLSCCSFLGIMGNSFSILSSAKISVISPRLVISSIMHQWIWKEEGTEWEKDKMMWQEQAEVITNPWESFQENYHSFNNSSGAFS